MNITILFYFLTIFLCHAILSQNVSETCIYRYVIVIDGGSSGTRLNIFRFNENQLNTKLIKGFDKKKNVGFSSFNRDRQDWAALESMMAYFIKESNSFINSTICVKETPFYVQSTAGMRQIKSCLSLRVMHRLNNILTKTNFIFNNSFNKILSTAEEGELAWISVNFLSGNLGGNKSVSKETYGVLDLGGGSTQIAFATKDTYLKDHSKIIAIFGKHYHVYSRGYDYMGIDVTRLKIFNAKECINEECGQELYRSSCVHHNLTTTLKLSGREMNIKGIETSDNLRMLHCYAKGKSYVEKVQSVKQSILNQTFFVISAYYYAFNNAKTILSKNKETNITTIITATRIHCNNPGQFHGKYTYFKNFLCIDLTYIIALMNVGYGIDISNNIKSDSKIKKTDLSWALGFAILKL